ncbi:MAG: LTA synthase family protein [Flavobacteriia bacterium]|nr:LTA synthase family protein [Flavobacteriia bacterium]
MSLLIVLPFILLSLYLFSAKKIYFVLSKIILFLIFFLINGLHAGEINAYSEWNHKLTSRVFMHLANPDEVVRSADYSMIIWFFVYFILEMLFSIFLSKKLLSFLKKPNIAKNQKKIPQWALSIVLFFGVLIVQIRGGFQAIPININSAIFSKNPVSNDMSINSLYFFSKSYLLYSRSTIDEYIPKINSLQAKQTVDSLYNYSRGHNEMFLKNQRPNIVFVVLESWVADAVSCIGQMKNSTPHFDQLAKEGILFSNVYSTSHTSEIGNASIFSGFPAIPEVSISMQPEKSRKLKSINQVLKSEGYSSSYLFSGDLKYGNIGGFFMDHNFDKVMDENDFSGDLKKGKLNYYDEDLYKKFIQEIDGSKEPFIQCAFTGSTHSPYDFPRKQKARFFGKEADFMNSMVYADQCIDQFIRQAKKKPWYKNTLFVFVADHGHASPNVDFAMNHEFYHIPLLFWGEVIKQEFKGKKITKKGSQADIPLTLLIQMGFPVFDSFPWSKDLMNPLSPEFVFHSIIRGYGWGSANGHLAYQFEMKSYIENTFQDSLKNYEQNRGAAYLKTVYEYYKKL